MANEMFLKVSASVLVMLGLVMSLGVVFGHARLEQLS